MIFKEQGRKGEEPQKTFNSIIMDAKKKSRSRKMDNRRIHEIGIFLDLTYCNSLETFLPSDFSRLMEQKLKHRD